jgi:nucleotide-binding universal stress UspA family protein
MRSSEIVPGTSVVVGVDGSPHSVAALGWAEDYATSHHAKLVAVIAWGDGLPQAARGAGLDVASSAQHALASFVSESLGPERARRVEQLSSPQSAADTLVDLSAKAALVVLGSHHPHVERPLGTVITKVLERSTAPVAVVPNRPLELTRRIVVGFDGTPPARHALGWAIEHARRTGDEIDAVHACDIEGPLPYSARIVDRPPSDRQERLSQELSHELGAVPRDIATRLRSHALDGPAFAVLLREGQDADLVVVGRRSRHTASERVLGSVSTRLARRSVVPVVVVPTDKRAEPSLG